MLHLHNGYPFLMPIAKVASQKEWAPYAVVHDYTPVVCASFYPHLKTIEIHRGHPDQYGRRVAFGIGTGLGLKDGALIPNGDFWLGNNEMGHIGLCAGNVPANQHLSIENLVFMVQPSRTFCPAKVCLIFIMPSTTTKSLLPMNGCSHKSR